MNFTALLEKKEKEEEMELIPHEIQITADKIKKFTFPIYVPPNVKDDMVRDLFSLFIQNSRCMKQFFFFLNFNS